MVPFLHTSRLALLLVVVEAFDLRQHPRMGVKEASKCTVICNERMNELLLLVVVVLVLVIYKQVSLPFRCRLEWRTVFAHGARPALLQCRYYGWLGQRFKKKKKKKRRKTQKKASSTANLSSWIWNKQQSTIKLTDSNTWTLMLTPLWIGSRPAPYSPHRVIVLVPIALLLLSPSNHIIAVTLQTTSASALPLPRHPATVIG
jgi:hypothetical protein